MVDEWAYYETLRLEAERRRNGPIENVADTAISMSSAMLRQAIFRLYDRVARERGYADRWEAALVLGYGK